MPSEAAPETALPAAATPNTVGRPAWWVRVLSRLPLTLLYGITGAASWLAFRVVPHRVELIEGSLAKAFPELGAPQLKALRRRYYRGFAQMLAEIVKASALAPAEIRRRVAMVNLEE